MDNTLIDRIVGVFSRAAMPIVSCALAMAIAFIPGTALAGADDEGDLDAPNAAAGGTSAQSAQEDTAIDDAVNIAADGKSYDILAEQPIQPTSELPSHLLMHNFLRAKGRDNRVVLHTHPTDIIGMTHCKPFLDSEKITRTLWSMIPECRIIVPKGVGIVPYEIPGTLALAHATIRQLEEHDVVFWEKHGILAVGEDLIECFDAIDTLSKSAQIYFSARMTGYEPEGMTEQQLDDLVPAFGL